MAKTSMVERETKRAQTVAKYAVKRTKLKEIIRSPKFIDEEKWDAQVALQKLPRNASPSRMRSRCSITGRSRGVYRKFGLCRIKIREYGMKGDIPGLVKASW